MTKSILIPFLLLVACSTFAQNHFLGVTGGVSWTNASAKSMVSNDRYSKFMTNRSGFTAGVSYESRVKQHVLVGADLMYQQRGFNGDIYLTGLFGIPYVDEIRFDYDYLAIPLKCGYIIGNRISAFANIGLVPSILLKATAKVPDEFDTKDITDLPQRFDLAGRVEAGGNYKISQRLLVTVTFAYQNSFTIHSNANYFEESDLRHHGMMLSSSVKYALKKD